MTQQELADQIGSTQQAINGYENRGIEPDFDTLIKIADCLNSSVDYLICRTELRAYHIETMDFIISENEIGLVKQYRRLPAAVQEQIAGLIGEYLKR